MLGRRLLPACPQRASTGAGRKAPAGPSPALGLRKKRAWRSCWRRLLSEEAAGAWLASHSRSRSGEPAGSPIVQPCLGQSLCSVSPSDNQQSSHNHGVPSGAKLAEVHRQAHALRCRSLAPDTTPQNSHHFLCGVQIMQATLCNIHAAKEIGVRVQVQIAALLTCSRGERLREVRCKHVQGHRYREPRGICHLGPRQADWRGHGVRHHMALHSSPHDSALEQACFGITRVLCRGGTQGLLRRSHMGHCPSAPSRS